MKNRFADYRYYWVLALPSILELLLTTFAQYADMAMVGTIGPDASAAVGVTTPLIWLVSAPQQALAVVLQSFIAFSIGKNDREQTESLADRALSLTLLLGVAEALIFCLAAPFIPGWMGADPALQKIAGQYFLIVSLPMPFRAAGLIFGSMLRGTGDMKTPMLVNFLMNLISVVLNFFLIYPAKTYTIFGRLVRLPGAGLGVIGAAIGTALAFTAGGLLMFLAVKKNPYLRNCALKRPFALGESRDILGKALPVALNRIGVALGHVVFTGLVTGLGTISLAAHSIAMTAEEFFYVPGYGMQAVSATLTGRALGENNKQKLRKHSRGLLVMSVTVMGLLCLVLFAGAKQIMSIFTPDAAVQDLGAEILRIVAVSEPIFAVFIILEGIFNGAGYTEKPFYIGIFCMWGIRIFGTWLCVKQFGLGLSAVWIMMVADNVARALLLTVLYLKGDWMRALE